MWLLATHHGAKHHARQECGEAETHPTIDTSLGHSPRNGAIKRRKQRPGQHHQRQHRKIPPPWPTMRKGLECPPRALAPEQIGRVGLPAQECRRQRPSKRNEHHDPDGPQQPPAPHRPSRPHWMPPGRQHGRGKDKKRDDRPLGQQAQSQCRPHPGESGARPLRRLPQPRPRQQCPEHHQAIEHQHAMEAGPVKTEQQQPRQQPGNRRMFRPEPARQSAAQQRAGQSR